MNWGWIARHTAVAIGLTFVVVAVIYQCGFSCWGCKSNYLLFVSGFDFAG